MRCDIHCPPAKGISGGAVVAAVLVLAEARPLLHAVAVVAQVAVITAVSLAGLAVTAALVCAGVRVHRWRAARAELVRAPCQIPAPPLALEAPRPVVHVITDARERTGR